MISINKNDVINKKATLDKVMDADNFTPAQIVKLEKQTKIAINRTKKLFPKLNQTRFKQIADYYSLVVLISKFETERLVLNDPKRNRTAWSMLKRLSTGVDEVRELQKKAKGATAGQEIFRNYLLTVQQATDEISQRRQRETILRGLLENIFGKRKDTKRAFTAEQRRILWHSTDIKRCKKCGDILSWDSFTVDHIEPFIRGGKTELRNAAILCRSCNSRKGSR